MWQLVLRCVISLINVPSCQRKKTIKLAIWISLSKDKCKKFMSYVEERKWNRWWSCSHNFEIYSENNSSLIIVTKKLVCWILHKSKQITKTYIYVVSVGWGGPTHYVVPPKSCEVQLGSDNKPKFLVIATKLQTTFFRIYPFV